MGKGKRVTVSTYLRDRLPNRSFSSREWCRKEEGEESVWRKQRTLALGGGRRLESRIGLGLGGGGRLVAVRLRGKLGAVGTSPSVLPSDPLRSLSSQSALPILFTARPFIECCSSPSPSQNACTEQLSSRSVAQVRIPLHAVTTN